MLTLTIDASDLRRLAKDVGALHEKVVLGIARGLNEGGDKTRTKVQRAIRAQTGLVRYSSVTSRVRTRRAFEQGTAPESGIGPRGGASLAYTIIVQGKPATKPGEFKYTVKRGPGGGVTVWMWGRPHKFKRSFQIAGQSGPLGLRMRTIGPRLPIRGFDGPNLAKEAVKDESAKAFFEGAFTVVMPAIEKQILKSIAR